MKSRRAPRAVGGFSLIELMVVIAIMAMLAGGVSLFLFGATTDAAQTRVRSDFAQLGEALKLYRLKKNRYPESLEELTQPLPGHAEALLDKIPKDPWGKDYRYRRIQGGYEIFTLGADDAEGGEGADKDLSSLDEDEEEAGAG